MLARANLDRWNKTARTKDQKADPAPIVTLPSVVHEPISGSLSVLALLAPAAAQLSSLPALPPPPPSPIQPKQKPTLPHNPATLYNHLCHARAAQRLAAHKSLPIAARKQITNARNRKNNRRGN